MQSEEVLIKDLERIIKKQKKTNERINDVVDNMIEDVQNFLESEGNIDDALENLYQENKNKNPLQEIKEEHKDYFAYISKFGKDLDKHFPYIPPELPKDLNQKLDENIIKKCIIEHLCREGLFDAAEALAGNNSLSIKGQMSVLHCTLQQIREGNVAYALD